MEHRYWWRHTAVMLFLPLQTTKYCVHWWCYSQKNLATYYSKQVLFNLLFFFQLISLPLSRYSPPQFQTRAPLSISHLRSDSRRGSRLWPPSLFTDPSYISLLAAALESISLLSLLQWSGLRSKFKMMGGCEWGFCVCSYGSVCGCCVGRWCRLLGLQMRFGGCGFWIAYLGLLVVVVGIVGWCVVCWDCRWGSVDFVSCIFLAWVSWGWDFRGFFWGFFIFSSFGC